MMKWATAKSTHSAYMSTCTFSIPSGILSSWNKLLYFYQLQDSRFKIQDSRCLLSRRLYRYNRVKCFLLGSSIKKRNSRLSSKE